MTQEQIKQQIITIIEARTERSAWGRGVRDFAVDLVDKIENINEYLSYDLEECDSALLNGADSWNQYAHNGCYLISSYDIVTSLCPPSIVKRYNYGEKMPNEMEDWLDVEGRALSQAAMVVYLAIRQFKGYINKEALQ